MHNLEQLIAEWRKTAATPMPNVTTETLDELEMHLRENVDQLVRSGMTVPDAFQRAVVELGAMSKVSSEFRKLDQPLWLPVKLAIGVSLLTALIMAIAVIGRFDSRAASLLLATHVFLVTVGYIIVLLIGGLGICFVSQRCFEDFPTSRLQSISRVSFILSGLALCLTAIGTILAMTWAKISWGRYWAWDSKEMGALCVVVWLVFYLLAHRFLKSSARGILTIGMLGNIVVSLAWFGPQLNGLHHYGTFSQSILMLTVVANLVFFALGYCPAGWLRANRA